MYDIFFYKDKNGKQPTLEYIRMLKARKDKDSRIKTEKIHDYMNYLRVAGLSAGVPYIKHIEGEIWELRPIRDRILFAKWDGKSFIILHNFMKKNQKTPQREIDQAKRNLIDYRERNASNDDE